MIEKCFSIWFTISFCSKIEQIGTLILLFRKTDEFDYLLKTFVGTISKVKGGK
jgi:hypothetical protein